ncbi:MAG: proton-conducting transporter membrane subunit [Rhodoglobus sp.]
MLELMLGGALAAAPVAAVVALAVGSRSADAAARATTVILGLGLLAAIASAALKPALSPPSFLRFDAFAAVMVVLVLGLSWVIQNFAVRYLRGDRRQVWFVVSANLITASTATLVCTATVLTFAVTWIAAGVSLVLALATYPHLNQARAGVRRTTLRFGLADLALVAAVAVLVVQAGGDVVFAELGGVFAAMPPALAAAVALLLVAPALARSSQFPFHGWLPSTLAAPTPVSALMHAGVVNAGAILIIRFAPAIGETPVAMGLIFAAGAITVLYASLMRMVKPDVKGRLVLSTMAQMGFMMLACGMGAFAAAVFHLVAHGLFKSALFLSAGTGVADQARQRDWPRKQGAGWPQLVAAIAVAAVTSVAAVLLARTVLGAQLSGSSQALQLFVVFTMAVALAAGLRTHFAASTALVGIAAITALAFGYTALVSVTDRLLGLSPVSAGVSPFWMLAPAAGLLLLELLPRLNGPLALRLYPAVLAAATPRTVTVVHPTTLVKEATP